MHWLKKGLGITIGVAVGLFVLRTVLNYVSPSAKSYFGLA